MIAKKVEKELARLKKRLFHSSKAHKQLEKTQYELDNATYELYDRITNAGFTVPIPIIRNIHQTVDKIIEDNCSLSRFGDGEFVLMGGGRIDYQTRNEEIAIRLKEVLNSDIPNLLIALPAVFGDLSHFLPPVAAFWRKWAARKRELIYSHLDMDRVYYDAFISRVYIQDHKTQEHYNKCSDYYNEVKKIWHGRDVVICEGQGTRFGMLNDLFDGATSISRILCPVRNAFDKYDKILSAFDGIDKQKLILLALGPTATVLSYDLCKKGYQVIDAGAFDVDYEWFLRKETRLGAPLEYKYVDSCKKGKTPKPLNDPEYQKQTMTIIE